MTIKGTDILAGLILVVALYGQQVKDKLPWLVPGTAPQPSPVVAPPDAAAQQAVAQVQTLLKTTSNRAEWAAYFADFADVIQKRPNEFKTVGDVIKQHELANDLLFDMDPVVPVTGLAVAMDGAIKALLGDDDKAVDQAAALRATRALQWAAQ